MSDARVGLVHDRRVGPAPQRADAELGFLAAHGSGADAADSRVKAAHLGEDLTPERHVGADEIPDTGLRHRHSCVRAADDPIELGGERARPAARPERIDGSADADHTRGVVSNETLEPVGLGHRVVVDEGDEACVRGRDSGVARARQPRRICVCERGRRGELGADTLEQSRVVVDDDDDLEWQQGLRRDGFHRTDEVLPPSLGVRADDHGDRRLVSRLARSVIALQPSLPQRRTLMLSATSANAWAFVSLPICTVRTPVVPRLAVVVW